jgi:hypothetical protein
MSGNRRMVARRNPGLTPAEPSNVPSNLRSVGEGKPSAVGEKADRGVSLLVVYRFTGCASGQPGANQDANPGGQSHGRTNAV